jgi:hypothetical protein
MEPLWKKLKEERSLAELNDVVEPSGGAKRTDRAKIFILLCGERRERQVEDVVAGALVAMLLRHVHQFINLLLRFEIPRILRNGFLSVLYVFEQLIQALWGQELVVLPLEPGDDYLCNEAVD